MADQLSSNNSTQQQQTSAGVIPCTICGVPSRGSVYGAIACEACKAFFKRNAEYGLDALKCHYDGHCDININTRHTCAYCRLTKCFASGMQKELLRCPLSKTKQTNKKRKTMNDEVQIISTVSARSNQVAHIPTLNLLRADQSTLSVDQWNLLSNISHCYDDYGGLSAGEKYMSEQNSLPLKIRYKSASIIQLYQTILDTAQSLYRYNRDFLSLSADDRSVVLHSTSLHTGSILASFICYRIGLANYPTYYETVEMISSPTAAEIVRRISLRINFDMVVMKLFVAILSFSTYRCTIYPQTCSENLSNLGEILRIQDKYVELTWRYLLYKYDHQQSVKCFSDFIKCLFVVNEGLFESLKLQWVKSAMDIVTEKTKQTLSMND